MSAFCLSAETKVWSYLGWAVVRLLSVSLSFLSSVWWSQLWPKGSPNGHPTPSFQPGQISLQWTEKENIRLQYEHNLLLGKRLPRVWRVWGLGIMKCIWWKAPPNNRNLGGLASKINAICLPNDSFISWFLRPALIVQLNNCNVLTTTL